MITQEKTFTALVTDWDKVESQVVGKGIKRQMVIGQKIMVCRFTFDPFVVTPEHTHPHEQVTMVMKGRVKFTISGEERIVKAGDVLGTSRRLEPAAETTYLVRCAKRILSSPSEVRQNGHVHGDFGVCAAGHAGRDFPGDGCRRQNAGTIGYLKRVSALP